jgi:tetrahydromethanopterin S-methyltransferase subunit G
MENWIIAENIIAIAALLAASTIIIVATVKTSKFVKRIVHFFDDFLGESERPGVPPRPGFSERMSKMELCINKVNQRLNTIEHKVQSIDKELQPNSGLSLRDAVTRIERRLEHVEAEVQ